MGRVLKVHTPKALGAFLLAPLFVCVFLVTPTFADDGTSIPSTTSNNQPQPQPPVENPEPVVSDQVAAPGIPVVTSPENDKDITWEWPAPTPVENGETPANPGTDQPTDTPSDEPVEQPVEEQPGNGGPTPEPTPAPTPTGYGYELTKDSEIIQSGEVGLEVRSVTTTVKADGTYVFRVWTLAGSFISNKVEAQTTIVTPTPPVVFVPIEVGELLPDISAPLLRETIRPAAVAAAEATRAIAETSATAASPDFTGNAQVLSTQDSAAEVDAPIAAVVKPSTQGWVLFGLPWYIWLLVAAIIFTGWRWVRVVLANRAQ
jgi:hypothetical protein